MHLSIKLTISRIIIAFIIILILVFPFESAGINFPNLFVNEMIVINIKYLIVAGLFAIAMVTDFLDDRIAKKRNEVTEFGKVLDSTANKVLIDSVLVILTSQGFLHTIIPVIVITRDIVVNAVKIMCANKGKGFVLMKLDKLRNPILMIGILLTLIYNLPFELINLRVSDLVLIVGAVISFISGLQYYNENIKEIIKK